MFLILVLPLLICGYIYTRVNRTRRFADKIPGEKPWPFIGNVLCLGIDPVKLIPNMMKFWQKYNRKIFGFWVGMDYYVVLSEPEDVEVILRSNTHLTKMKDYRFVEPWVGNGLATSKGDEWRQKRKILTPTFHFQILEQYAEVFNSSSDVLIKKLKDKADGRVIDIHHYTTLYALDVVLESAMGVKLNAQENASSDIVQAIFDICFVMVQRLTSIWKRVDLLFKFSESYRIQQKALGVISAFNEKVILERAAALRGKSNGNAKTNHKEAEEIKKKNALLDMLLTTTIDGENLPDKIIQDEVATFIFVGQDTVSIALAFGLYSFANNPEVQRKAYAEQVEIFGNDKNRHPTYQDYQNMKYLDLCIKEILRLYPSAPAVGRLAEVDIDINGNIVPAGASIIIPIYAMHRNPKYFNDPEKFNPDRFLPEHRVNRHPYEYLPFSAGPRNCIGQKYAILELKSVYSKMLRNYEILSAGPELDPILYFEITLKSNNGVSVKLAPRN